MNKNRKSYEILNALGNVDSQFIEEANVRGATGKKTLGMRRKIAAVLLAATVAAAGLGAAVSAGRLNKSFGQLFHSLSEENYESALFDINQTAADNGVTVTLMQGLCDGRALYVTEKIEFATDVLVLTDEMFEGDRPFGWIIDDAIDVDKSRSLSDKDKAVVSESGGIFQVIEHDEHSVTVLLIYGGEGISHTESGFFDENSLFTISQTDLLQCLSENIITCHFDFTFNVKHSSPCFYTLPEEIYQVDYYAEPLDQTLADVGINPWFIYFSAGAGTGKILDTSLQSDSQPSLEITMNDGTVYTERNGIRVFNDYFGKDYDQNNFMPCCFDTPIDIKEIKSIKIYGHELKSGVVKPGKERVMAEDKGKMNLPANHPVQFSDEFTTIDLVDYEGSSGRLAYRLLKADLYDNIYATGAKKYTINYQGLEDFRFDTVRYDNAGHAVKTGYDDVINASTGELEDGYYILELEVEVKNIDAENKFSGSTFDYAGTSIFNKMFHVNQYDQYSPSKNRFIPLVYLKEDEVKRTGQYGDFKLKKGKTRKLHLGFLFTDNNAGSPDQICFIFGRDFYNGTLPDDFEGYKTFDSTYFNISKLLQEHERKK